MKNLVYLSTARTLFSEDILLDILKSARRANAERHVTGVLLYAEGTFIQVLEGEENDVDAIYTRIEQDPRHKNLTVIMDGPIDKRDFPGWSMGFNSLDKATGNKFLNDLTTTDQILSKGNDKTTIIVLKSFIESNNLVITY